LLPLVPNGTANGVDLEFDAMAPIRREGVDATTLGETVVTHT